MKSLKTIILSLIAAMVLFSCTDDYEELNTDPNNLLTAPLANIFAYTEYIVASQFGGNEISYAATYIGHAANYRYMDEVTYSVSGPGSPWDFLYVNVINNLEFIIDEAEENTNMRAAAMVLRAYAYQLLVDMHGPVPYFQASQGNDAIIFPEFDTEEVIYLDLLEQLKSANELFDEGSAYKIGPEDQIFEGDISKWKKFGNSLRLRLAIRISNVVEQTARDNISEILNDPATYPVFESNDDSPFVKYPGDANYKEPWSRYSDITQYRIGKPLVDKLLEFNDPRIHEYADTNRQGEYVGIVIGATSSTNISKIDKQWVDNDSGSVYLMKYCEVEFIKAEAAARSFVSSSAQEAYEAGITASLAEYNMHDTIITNYIAEPGVAWTGDVTQIYTQKWLSFFHQSWEAWAEMRRTDVPLLDLAINSTVTGHNRVPFRFNYPNHVKSNNGRNLPSFVSEDDYYWGYQVWWDIRTGVQ